jgi:hypothetical protein
MANGPPVADFGFDSQHKTIWSASISKRCEIFQRQFSGKWLDFFPISERSVTFVQSGGQ